MNLIQLRFSAALISNIRLLTALQAGFSAYRHLNSRYSIELARENGWLLEVHIGGTPFTPDHELVTSALLRQGLVFEIAFSPMGVDGQAVDVMYGLRRALDVDIVWRDEPQPLTDGCPARELDREGLASLDLDIRVEAVGQDWFVIDDDALAEFEKLSDKRLTALTLSADVNAVHRDTARYLLRSARHARTA